MIKLKNYYSSGFSILEILTRRLTQKQSHFYEQVEHWSLHANDLFKKEAEAREYLGRETDKILVIDSCVKLSTCMLNTAIVK